MNVLKSFSAFLFQRAKKTQRRSGPSIQGSPLSEKQAVRLGGRQWAHGRQADGKLNEKQTKQQRKKPKYLLEHTAYKKVIRKFTIKKRMWKMEGQKVNYMKVFK